MNRFFLDEDDDGHWYLVPVDSKMEWDKWIADLYDTEDGWEQPYPDGIVPIGGHPNLVEFENPEVK